jgi:uncharacterized protein
MEIIIYLGAILVILGIIGSIVPMIPGPLFSFAGIALLLFMKSPDASLIRHLIVFGVFLVFLTIGHYLFPVWGAKIAGSSKNGMYGAIIGAIIGIFFTPLGILIGAMIGAIIGEYYSKKTMLESLKAGLGIVLGSAVILVAQIVYSVAVAVYFFIKIT